MARVVLAMSGGVDSSVAAWLLRQEGHDVVGLFMRHGVGAERACPTGSEPRSRKKRCCSAADAADAQRVADMLDLPFYALNFDADFGRIVDYFVDEYTAGRTPNPCILCNTWLKFGKLFEYADRIGARYVATGHHARLVWEKGTGPICAKHRAPAEGWSGRTNLRSVPGKLDLSPFPARTGRWTPRRPAAARPKRAGLKSGSSWARGSCWNWSASRPAGS